MLLWQLGVHFRSWSQVNLYIDSSFFIKHEAKVMAFLRHFHGSPKTAFLRSFCTLTLMHYPLHECLILDLNQRLQNDLSLLISLHKTTVLSHK